MTPCTRMTKTGEKTMHFAVVPADEVPQGRRGKHSKMVSEILNDLSHLPEGSAIKVPLEGLGDAKLANLRSALNRATRQRRLHVATSTDKSFLYIWTHKKQRSSSRGR